MISGDRVRVSVQVDLAPEDAFRVFTEEIDQWWRRGSRFRASGPHRGVLCLEPRLGGGLFETFQDDDETQVVRIGTVTQWEPPRQVEIAWRNLNFAPDEITRLTVGFESSGTGRTLVTVTHDGWASLRPDHPARHGLATGPFLSMMGRWWGDLLGSLREYASEPSRPASGARVSRSTAGSATIQSDTSRDAAPARPGRG